MDFPRTLLPFETSDFNVTGPLISRAQSGRVNLRATEQVGRTWSERYLIRMSDADSKAFLAFVRNAWRAGTIFDISHVDYLTPNGVGGGTPLVNGASQTGSSLVVDGAPATTTGWLLAGDIFSIAGINITYEVTADVDTDGAGNATIQITPPIFDGGSPADDAALTITAVKLKAVILNPPEFPTTGPNDFGELILAFVEAL